MNRNEFRHGIHLFNRDAFFDAHEVWEDVWRASAGPEKKFLQGLIQVAVAFHHHSTGNIVGARSLLERAHKNLVHHPKQFEEIELSTLLESMAAWRDALATGGPKPALPKLPEIR